MHDLGPKETLEFPVSDSMNVWTRYCTFHIGIEVSKLDQERMARNLVEFLTTHCRAEYLAEVIKELEISKDSNA